MQSSINAVSTRKAPPKLDPRLQPCDRNSRPLSYQHSPFLREEVMPCHAPAAASGLRCRTSRALSASRTSTSCAQRSDGGGREGTTRSDSHPYSHPRRCLPCPHTDTPVAAARPGAGASPARGTCPLRDPPQDAAATRNRNPGEDQPLQEARASHAGSGKLPFRPFPLALYRHGRRGVAARPPSRAAPTRSAPATAQRVRLRTGSGTGGSG